VCIGSNFDTLLCGNVISPNRNKDLGEWYTATVQIYAYNLATLPGFIPDPGWEWLLKDSSEWGPYVEELRAQRQAVTA
jgi:hypothetical protein